MPKNSPWFICRKPNPNAYVRLFCFPFAGGGASIYRQWPDLLPSYIEVWAIQLPGRERRMREAPFTRLTSLVNTLAQEIRPYLDMPFVFFGHSMGALISFELTRELYRQQAALPLHLFVSGRRAPQMPQRTKEMHRLPDAQFVDELRNYNGTPEAVLQNKELMELFLPLLRADFAVNETYTYQPEPLLDCPLTAFGGWQDKTVNHYEVAAWQEQTSSKFKLHMLPGGHFFIQSQQKQLFQLLLQYDALRLG